MTTTLDNTASSLPPASAAKHESIIEAAAQVFLASGYGDASMDQIANAAGVSKQTVYSHFGTKDALFGAIINGKCQTLMNVGDAVPLEGQSLESALTKTATQFLRLLLRDENTTLFRIIVSESERFPELARTFYEVGPTIAVKRLAEFLKVYVEQGEVNFPEPRESAELFFAMMRDDLYMKRVLGLGDLPDEEEIARRARRTVRLFLKLHANTKSP